MFNKLNPKRVTTHLLQYVDPLLEQPLVHADNIKECSVEDGNIKILLQFGFPCQDLRLQWQADLHAYLQELPGMKNITIDIEQKLRAHVVQNNLAAIPGVKNIICVASGKGGVGKSTTAVNLALALKHMGANVGLLDCDIYGPNQPQMLGALERPEITPEKKFKPLFVHGLQTMSIGYLVDEQTAMVWRGPMISKALQQLMFDTLWQNLDYLILDMPPGTGDISLTLAQKIPTAGSVLVTTPQTVATLDVQKGLEMLHKVGIPILGVVENMSLHICGKCGEREAIFGEGGGEKITKQFAVPLLGRLPLNKQICEDVDRGLPTVARDPQDRLALDYLQIARRMTMQLAKQKIKHGTSLPRVVVE